MTAQKHTGAAAMENLPHPGRGAPEEAEEERDENDYWDWTLDGPPILPLMQNDQAVHERGDGGQAQWTNHAPRPYLKVHSTYSPMITVLITALITHYIRALMGLISGL